MIIYDHYEAVSIFKQFESKIIYNLYAGLQNGGNEKSVCINLKKFIFGNILSKKCRETTGGKQTEAKIRVLISRL